MKEEYMYFILCYMLYALGWLFEYTYLWFNVYILGISLLFFSSSCMYRLIHFFYFFLSFLCSSIHYVRQSAKEMPIFFYSGYSFHCLFYMLYFFLLLIYCNKFGFQFLYSYFFNTSGFMQFCCCCIAASIL